MTLKSILMEQNVDRLSHFNIQPQAPIVNTPHGQRVSLPVLCPEQNLHRFSHLNIQSQVPIANTKHITNLCHEAGFLH